MKKISITAISFLLAAIFCAIPAAAATLTTVNTQYTYSASNPAWLKDLVVKEDMTNSSGTATSSVLTANPDYPYSKTPEGFRTEVNYYRELYSLDENSQKAAYLYVLQYVNRFASEATRNVSDEFIMEYLKNEGIAYPDGGLGDYENLIFARALYTLLSTNAVKITVTPGTTVQSALIQCMTQIFGIDAETLAKWSTSQVDTIDKYVIVACKIALNTNGFSVDKNTDDKEVYRLTAVMMIRQLGISVNAETATFDEIRIKYLAALLGQQYDISINPADLQAAINAGDVPFYILKVMGKTANLTIRDSTSYSSAFTSVAENTDFFALPQDEFYADIYNYSVRLNYKRNRIWISPSAYKASSATETVMIRINNELTPNGNYYECPLDENLEAQDIIINVTYQSPSKTVSKDYTLTVLQGSEPPPENGENSLYPSGGNSLIGIFANNTVNALTNSFYSVSSALPARVKNIMSLMVPEINAGGNSQSAGSPDYLSTLMATASGTMTTPDYITAAAKPAPSKNGLYGIGGLASYGSQGGMGISTGAEAPSADSLYGVSGEGMLLSQAGEPPEGYEYLCDDNGYITGIAAVHRHTGAANIEKSGISFSEIKSVFIRILIPMIIAAAVVVTITILRVKDKKTNKKAAE